MILKSLTVSNRSCIILIGLVNMRGSSEFLQICIYLLINTLINRSLTLLLPLLTLLCTLYHILIFLLGCYHRLLSILSIVWVVCFYRFSSGCVVQWIIAILIILLGIYKFSRCNYFLILLNTIFPRVLILRCLYQRFLFNYVLLWIYCCHAWSTFFLLQKTPLFNGLFFIDVTPRELWSLPLNFFKRLEYVVGPFSAKILLVFNYWFLICAGVVLI